MMVQLGHLIQRFKYSKIALAGAGTQTAALVLVVPGPLAITGATEEYDGTSWTSNPTGLNTARNDLAGCGTQTAALAFGGQNLLQEQQKNMMVLLGHQILLV
jgi:hypothetical protein